MFQIVRLMLNDAGDIIACRPFSPCSCFGTTLMAIARNEPSGLWGDFGLNEQRQCWWRLTVAPCAIGLSLKKL